MKLTTIGLAIVLALSSRFAFAEGTLNYSTPVVRPVVRGITILGPPSRSHLSKRFPEHVSNRQGKSREGSIAKKAD
jgi:hypothetical protein